jgi:hypothetical protein
MADYRDLAAALGGGYGQDTGGITPDTLITLKNGKTASVGDLLGLLKGFGQSVGSNLESLGRGGLSTFLGTPVDTANMALSVFPMEVPDKYGNINYTPETELRGGSRDILGMMPRATAARPETAGMEELGKFMAPATTKVLKPLATGYLNLARQEIANVSSGMPSRSLLGDITPKPKLLDVYHGTPHTLPPTKRNPLGEFDASKIGTGEGAQAYGYGIYTAEARKTGERYRSQLAPERNASDLNTKMRFVQIGEKPINPDTFDVDVSQELIDAAKSGKKEFLDFANQKKLRWEQLAKDESYKFQPYAEEKVKAYDDLIQEAEKSGVKYTGAGNLYKIDLPDEKIATMMDWDKPLSQQSAQVKEALKGIEQNLPSIPDFDLKKWMETDPLASTWHNVLARDLKVEPSKISELLQNKGVAGIKYLDELSRSTKYKGDSAYLYAGKDFKENGYSLENALEGMKQAYKDANPQELKDALDAVYTPQTRNFVVFPNEEKNMTILERNAEKITK